MSACTTKPSSSAGADHVSATSGAPAGGQPGDGPRGSPEVGLPDPRRTPGAIDPAVTQANIRTTICVPGYTRTVRPPEPYTSQLKRRQLDSGYSVGSDRRAADYEEDHLIPLGLGGNPTDEHNLWPQPRAGVYGAGAKDRLELAVHERVCSGQWTLAQGQAALSGNWIASARSLGVLTP